LCLGDTSSFDGCNATQRQIIESALTLGHELMMPLWRLACVCCLLSTTVEQQLQHSEACKGCQQRCTAPGSLHTPDCPHSVDIEHVPVLWRPNFSALVLPHACAPHARGMRSGPATCQSLLLMPTAYYRPARSLSITASGPTHARTAVQHCVRLHSVVGTLQLIARMPLLLAVIALASVTVHAYSPCKRLRPGQCKPLGRPHWCPRPWTQGPLDSPHLLLRAQSQIRSPAWCLS
jgi:hypothetical protein